MKTCDSLAVAGRLQAASLPIQWAVMPDRTGAVVQHHSGTWSDFAAWIANPPVADAKDRLPLVKLAVFGDLRTQAGSLRHDANLRTVYGIEADYDAGVVSPEDAAQRLRDNAVLALVVSTPSSTPNAPRWRVFAPTSRPVSPGERAALVSTLNGALGGILAPESWTASQAFYVGRIAGRPYTVLLVDDGLPIDELDILVEPIGKTGKPEQATDPGPEPADHDREPDETLVRRIVSGESLHGPLRDLAARWAHRGMPVASIIKTLRALLYACPEKVQREQRWRERLDDLPRLVRSAAKFRETANTFVPVDLSTLLAGPPEPREWLVDGWLPRGALTLCAGRGASGKSTLALQLAAVVAEGSPFLGLLTRDGSVVVLAAEDDPDEVRRRLYAISRETGVSVETLAARVHVDARHGRVSTLVAFGPDGLPLEQPLLASLREKVAEVRPALVIVDNVAQVFAGRGNDAGCVTMFCALLSGIAADHGCAVLLLHHPARAEGSEFSGAAAWENAVRSRWFFERREDGTNVLSQPKANYGAHGAQIVLQWHAGAFCPLEEDDRSGGAKAVIVGAIKYFDTVEQACSAAPRAPNYLPKLMARDGLLAGIPEATIAATLRQMAEADELHTGDLPYCYANRSPKRGLVVGPAPVGDLAVGADT
jgi:RecA-family ATPase